MNTVAMGRWLLVAVHCLACMSCAGQRNAPSPTPPPETTMQHNQATTRETIDEVAAMLEQPGAITPAHARPVLEGMLRHARAERHRLEMLGEGDAERIARFEAHAQLTQQAARDPRLLEGRQFVVAFDMGEAVSRDWPGHYWVFLPHGYFDDDQPWRTLWFLHGSGERGNDPHAVLLHGPPKHVLADRGNFPGLVLSPQAPDEHEWESAFLDAFAEDAFARFRADPNRVVLTGISRGGAGAWNWAIERPELFAAVAPICGWVNPVFAERLASVPVWVAHSADDPVVPVYHSDLAVARLRALGGDVSYSRTENEGHGSWRAAYEGDAFWEWAMARERTKQIHVPAHPAEVLGLSGGDAGRGLGPMREVRMDDVPGTGTALGITVEAAPGGVGKALYESLQQFYPAHAAHAGEPAQEGTWLLDEVWFRDGRWQATVALPTTPGAELPEGTTLVSIPGEGRALVAWFHGTAIETANAWLRMEQRALLDGYNLDGRRLQRVHDVDRMSTVMMRELFLGVEE